MSFVYYEKKKATEHLDNVWPVKHIVETPEAFFRERGLADLIVYVNPKLQNKTYFVFEMYVYNVSGARFQRYGDAERVHIPILLQATYVNKYFSISTVNYTEWKERDDQDIWGKLHTCVDMLHAAVEECNRFFPKQNP